MPSASPPPILLVDDNDEDLSLTQLLLKKSQIANPVLTAIGGEGAIAVLRDPKAGQTPFLVLCDVRMPRIDGLEVLKWVRAQSRLNAVYFAMHSGGDVPADRARARWLGADEYLVKFPTREEIHAIVAQAEVKWRRPAALVDDGLAKRSARSAGS